MKKAFIIIGLAAFAAFVLAGIYFLGKPGPVRLPEEETVAQVQLDTFKVEAKKLGKDRLRGLMSGIEAAAPLNRLESMQMKREENYYVAAFLYTDASRASFYFFNKDGRWYMETEQGNVYANAEFITEYTQAGQLLEQEDSATTAAILGSTLPDMEIIRYGAETDFGMSYWFASLMKSSMEAGWSEEDACLQAKNTIFSQMCLYEYAKEHGYEISEKQYQKELDDMLTAAKQQEAYPEVEAAYEEAGTSLEEVMEEASWLGRINSTVENLRQAKWEEFRNGQDTIDGVSQDSAQAYWNAFVLSQVESAMDGSRRSKMEEALEEAERAYLEYLANSQRSY